jgi:PAS domain S-box-containing protein
MPAWFLPAVYINDSLKAIISAALLRRLNHGTPQLTGMQELVKFFAVAVLGVPILSAFAGAATRLAIGDPFWSTWQRWFLGNALANLLLTPMILYWIKGGVSAVRSAGIKRCIEGILLIMALILAGFKAFSGAGSHGASPLMIYLPFPLLLYTAVRFGPRGISSALSLITAFAIWNAELGRGPFSAQAPGGDVLTLQLFLCVISVPLLCLSVLLQERQRVGEALRESEERFRNMADNAPVMVWMTDPDGVCAYLSESWYEYTGQTPETGLGFGWAAALHPDDCELSKKNFLSANEKREAFRLEYRLLRKDGKYRWAINSAIPRFDSQGGFLGYIGSVVDITETKHAELNTQFINQLNFGLSQTSDADEIIRLATSRLGEYLGVTSCYLIEVDSAAGLAIVRENWDGWSQDTPDIVGEYRISDYGAPELIEALKAGQTIVVKDVTSDPRTRDFASQYELIGVGAFVSIPALNKGRWESSLTVNYLRARDWRPDETQLMRDISASLWPAFKRARAVEALRESEARYRSVVESQTDLICRYLPDTTLTFVNDAYCRYFGKTQAELIGTKFLDLIPAPAREATRKHIESLVESPRVEIDEHKVLLPDGSVGWQQWVDHAILDANGKVVEFQAVGCDITQRKQVEEERREGEERLRLALEAGRMGVWEWDTRTNAVKWSKEHYTVMGLRPFIVEPDYHSWADHVHPDDLAMAAAAMNRAIEEEREYRAEYRIIRPDGATRWVEGRGKPIYDEHGQCLKVNGLIVDITERKEAEQALRESEEALRKSYARIEDLARRLIVAQEEERRHIARELHDDLNQQVAALAIGISRLKRQLPTDARTVQDLIAKLRDKTEQLSEHIRQVSHELHSSILQHVGLPAALNSYCAEFSDREGIAVTLDIQDGLEALPSDMALCLYRVAQESLRNVSRHSGARRAAVSLTCVKGAVELRVADQGVGFDPGQAREFRGLGLVSMEERVKLLRGAFVLTTRPGAGTELRARIPLRREHEQAKSFVG